MLSIHSSRDTDPSTRIDLNALVREIVDEHRQQAEARSIHWGLCLVQNPCFFGTESEPPRSLIGELVRVALAHTPEGGTLLLNTSVGADSATVEFWNAGATLSLPPTAWPELAKLSEWAAQSGSRIRTERSRFTARVVLSLQIQLVKRPPIALRSTEKALFSGNQTERKDAKRHAAN